MEKITETAYAKINLGLDVLGTRPDGYHEVCMVMQSVSLADTVTLEPHEGLCVVTGKDDLPGDDTNLAWKAAMLMASRFGQKPDVKITLDKRIFMAAGLAGGSSDAAAVLRGLNRLWQLNLSVAELEALAAEIGSDVPFCIAGGTQLSEGRGTDLTVLPSPEETVIVLGKPKIAVSTAWVYREFDALCQTAAARHGQRAGRRNLRQISGGRRHKTKNAGRRCGLRADERQRADRFCHCKR